jgi:formate dehydrogenase subunit beta
VTGYTDKLRAAARRLLSEGKVDCFIGYRQGSVPLVHHPVVITRAEQADTLVWDENCALNLANYVIGRKDRVGIVATGCVSRNLVILIQEHQVTRDQLHIVGVPCTGMRDGEGIARNCRICAHHNPVIHDELIGEPVPDPAGYVTPDDVAAAAGQSEVERWDFFQQAFAPCIRCYACRNACPMCYCPTCFVDESRPQWVGKSSDPNDTLTFHFLRALHLGGRCTDCGACERACPLNIPVRYLTSRLNAVAKQTYDYEAGLAEDQRPLLDQYRLEDQNDFFK